MQEKGPYRDMPNQDAENFEKMEKEIAAEGKFISINLPENIKIGAGVMFFGDAIKKNIDPKDIVFYSLATGILKYANQDEDKWTKKRSYRYSNPDNKYVGLTVEIPKRKYYPAILVNLSTKADAEAKERRFKEEQKKQLTNYMNKSEKYIQEIKKLIENDGKFPYGYPLDEEMKEVYLTKLKELRTSLKLLSETIDDKLKAAEKKD